MEIESKAYSLAKVANELGVSKAAVSLVMNGKARKGGISVDLEKRIMKFCRNVSYRPNIHAQRMNQRQVKNIGILINASGGVNEITPLGEYNISHVIGRVAVGADAVGYRFSTQLYKPDMPIERVIEWFRTREIDGLIYYGLNIPASWVKTFTSASLNVVGISVDPAQGIPCVNIDNYEASFKLTKHFINKGHKKFLYLAGNHCFPADQRYLGFRDALKEYNISFSEKSLLTADFDCATAENLIKERCMLGDLKEDAIICANDNMAIGVIRALKSYGDTYTDKIAIAGGDNIKIGQFISPSLTTFDFFPAEQGKAAFELLYRIITGERNPENVVIKSSLYFRDSG